VVTFDALGQFMKGDGSDTPHKKVVWLSPLATELSKESHAL